MFKSLVKLVYPFTALLLMANQIQAQSAEEAEAWMKYGAPGKEHELIGKFAGTWECQVTMSFAPDQTHESTATMTYSPVLGGRFMREEFKGDAGGMPFEGLGHWGYDNQKQKYVTVWMDSMSTGLMTSTGTYDEAAKTFTLSGTYTDPLGREQKTREVTKIIDADTYTFEMYQTGPDGKETLPLKMTAKRKSKAAAESK